MAPDERDTQPCTKRRMNIDFELHGQDLISVCRKTKFIKNVVESHEGSVHRPFVVELDPDLVTFLYEFILNCSHIGSKIISIIWLFQGKVQVFRIARDS